MITKVHSIDKDKTYNAVYNCGNGVFRVAKVNEKIFGIDPYKKPAQLQIQRTGSDFSLDALDFELGKPSVIHHIVLNGSSMTFVNGNEKLAEKIAQEYANEFEEVFRIDPKLHLFLSDYFTALQKYLK